MGLAQSTYRYPYNYGFTQGHYPYYYSNIYPSPETSVHYRPQYHAVYYPGLGYSLRYEATGTSNPLWNSYQSVSPGQSAPTGGAPDNTATLDVRVPVASAEVWIQDQKTTPEGMMRRFVSPGRTPGKRYQYTVRVEWMQNGKKVDQSQTVTIEAGHKVAVDFLPVSSAR
jgi:uncharacterized protein (TIGR03000 family)